jgi:hypothetical protein
MLGPPFTYNIIMLSIAVFIFGFYGISVVFVLTADSVRPPEERWWEPWETPSQIAFACALIIGFVSLITFFQIEPLQQTHISTCYLEAFFVPFSFILGNYILICWIIDGFQGS